MWFRHGIPIALLLPLFVSCAATGRTSTELSAQDLDERDKPAPTLLTTSTTSAVEAYDPSSDAPPQYNPSCPFYCVGMTPGRRHVPMTHDDVERIKTSFGPTMVGMHRCVSDAALGNKTARSPVLHLRFDHDSTLTDVGVDTFGFEGVTAHCLQNLVRGNSAPKVVTKLEGPVVVRCAERCSQTRTWNPHNPWTEKRPRRR